VHKVKEDWGGLLGPVKNVHWLNQRLAGRKTEADLPEGTSNRIGERVEKTERAAPTTAEKEEANSRIQSE